MPDRPICDPCRLAPASALAACVAAPYHAPSYAPACDESQCSWLVHSPRTLGVIWGGERGSVRGWGNSFSYLRNLHELAAILGRRLLVHPMRAFLPSDEHVRLGGRASWLLPSVSEYIDRDGAFVLHDEAAAAALAPALRRLATERVSPSATFVGLERSTNRSALKWEIVTHLDSLRAHDHLWLNLSKPAMYIITRAASPCVPVTATTMRHARAFIGCVGRLMTTPVDALATRRDEMRARLAALGIANASKRDAAPPSAAAADGAPPRYIGVHMRTFGADMGVPRGSTPDSSAALAFLSWEVQVNETVYAAEVRKLCREGTMPLYVASDSRAAIALFERLCPGRVVHQYAKLLGRSALVHSERLRAPAGGGVFDVRTHDASGAANRSGGISGGGSLSGGGPLLLDWLMLAGAHAVVRWGAQHSSFATSASKRACAERIWRSPKSWRYKAATSWLLGKLRFHSAKIKGNASYDCEGFISPMLRTIPPCSSGCVRACLAKVHSAFS